MTTKNKSTTFFANKSISVCFSFRPLVGRWVGKAEKWRSPFLGEDWRCGVSEANTAKANILKRSCPIYPSCQFTQNFNLIFFKVTLLLGRPRITYNVPAAWRSWGSTALHLGLSLTIQGRAEVRVVTLPPNFAKPLVICWQT